MIRNSAGQKAQFYSEISGVPNEGDAENITVTLTKYGVEAESTNSAAEIGAGVYEISLTKEETNCPVLTVTPTSTTEDAEFIPASTDYRMFMPDNFANRLDDDEEIAEILPFIMAVVSNA